MSASLQPHGLYSPWNSPGQKTGMGSLSLLQGIFPTQGSNPGLPHCRQILYQLSHREAQEYGVGSLSLLQRIFLTQKSNRGHLHCRQILYQLSYQESAITHTHTHTAAPTWVSPLVSSHFRSSQSTSLGSLCFLTLQFSFYPRIYTCSFLWFNAPSTIPIPA